MRKAFQQGLLGTAAIGCILAAGPCAAATLSRPGFTLAYDAAAWRERPAVPPSLLVIACLDPACAPGTLVSVIADPRLLPAVGVSRFGPGALGGASAVLRALAPGRQVALEAPATPVRIDRRPATRSRFAVLTPDLSRSALVDIALGQPGGTLHIALTGPALPLAVQYLFDRLVAGFAWIPRRGG